MKIIYNATVFTDTELQKWKFKRSYETQRLYQDRLNMENHVQIFEDDVRSNGELIAKDTYLIKNEFPYETQCYHSLIVCLGDNHTDPITLVSILMKEHFMPTLVFENEPKDQSVKTIKHYHVLY